MATENEVQGNDSGKDTSECWSERPPPLARTQPEDSTELGNEHHLSHGHGGELRTTLMKALQWVLPPQPGVRTRTICQGVWPPGDNSSEDSRRRLSDVVCDQLCQPQWKSRVVSNSASRVPRRELRAVLCVTLLKAIPERHITASYPH